MCTCQLQYQYTGLVDLMRTVIIVILIGEYGNERIHIVLTFFGYHSGTRTPLIFQNPADNISTV